MTSNQDFHSNIALKHWDQLIQVIGNSYGKITVNGHSLDLAAIVAVSRYAVLTKIDDDSLNRLSQSTKHLEESLRRGNVIYGVNTGFGGSADTRTNSVEALQRTLVRELHYGILASPSDSPRFERRMNGSCHEQNLETFAKQSPPLLLEDPITANCMPEAWVRAAILVRVNSLVSGYSGIRPQPVERMVDLLVKNITPRIPIHGSISASGDLSPLSYIGGAIQGKPTLTVLAGDGIERRTTTAKIALEEKGLVGVKLTAKEGLAIVNGTAISSALGALVLHDAHGLAIMAQVLTAMSVEALCGSIESYDPFFAKVRPHPGQVESAQNILKFLAGSRLVRDNDGLERGSLRQDRYSIRTASQWIGPILEDLVLAHSQVEVECNSVTDNPLIDTEGRSLHGGNFQAKVVTSAMEKTRQGIQTIGRMLFTQCTELINPATNRGLPPNLVADEPSESFIMKGVDLMVAALQAELGFLANPVGSHVQTAEMGNQALNSLALISARYTNISQELLSKLMAAHLIALCQALDLRVMHIQFLDVLDPQFTTMTSEVLGPILIDELSSQPSQTKAKLQADLWSRLKECLDQTSSMDSEDRFASIAQSLQLTILKHVTHVTQTLPTRVMEEWRIRCAALLQETYITNRDVYSIHPDATPFLGVASSQVYSFVRKQLRVPFLRSRQLETPESEPINLDGGFKASSSRDMEDVPTVGSLITVIYSALRSGELYFLAAKCLQEARKAL